MPHAKRGRALVFICHVCYANYGYDDYFFKPLHERTHEA